MFATRGEHWAEKWTDACSVDPVHAFRLRLYSLLPPYCPFPPLTLRAYDIRVLVAPCIGHTILLCGMGMLDYIILMFVFVENKRREREARAKWSTGGGLNNAVHQSVVTIMREQTTFSCMSAHRSWTFPFKAVKLSKSWWDTHSPRWREHWISRSALARSPRLSSVGYLF